jgi:hypothetical protein
MLSDLARPKIGSLAMTRDGQQNYQSFDANAHTECDNNGQATHETISLVMFMSIWLDE